MPACFDDVVAEYMRRGYSREHAQRIAGAVSQKSKRADKWSLSIPIAKVDQSKGLITGWAAISTDDTGSPVVDHDGEVLPIWEIEKAAHKAFLESGGVGKVGDMHRKRGVADLVETFVADVEKRKALGFWPPQDGHPMEGWVVSMQLNDPQVKKEVGEGKKLELSIRGYGRRVPLSQWTGEPYALTKNYQEGRREPSVIIDLELDSAELLSVVDQGASGNSRVSPRIVLIKNKTGGIMGIFQSWFSGSVKKQDGEMKSPEQMLQEIAADLPEDKANLLMSAIAAIMAAKVPEEKPAGEPAKPDANPETKPAADGQPASTPEAVKPEPIEPEAVAKAVKDLPKEAKEMIEKVLADSKAKGEALTDVSKKLDDVTKRLDDEIEKAARRESLEKARKTEIVPGDIEKRADLIRESSKMSDEARETLEKLLTDASAVIEKSKLLASEGAPGTGGPAEGSPEAKVEEMTKRRMDEVAKSGGKRLTIEQIRDQVWEDNPDLYKEYRKQQRGDA